jgi:hypothetical protein
MDFEDVVLGHHESALGDPYLVGSTWRPYFYMHSVGRGCPIVVKCNLPEIIVIQGEGVKQTINRTA